MAKVLTKSQVVAHLAEKAEIQKKAAAAVLEHLAALATKEVKGGGQFVFLDSGKLLRRTVKLAWAATRRPVSPSTFQRRRSSSFAWPRHSKMPWCLQRRNSVRPRVEVSTRGCSRRSCAGRILHLAVGKVRVGFPVVAMRTHRAEGCRCVTCPREPRGRESKSVCKAGQESS